MRELVRSQHTQTHSHFHGLTMCVLTKLIGKTNNRDAV